MPKHNRKIPMNATLPTVSGHCFKFGKIYFGATWRRIHFLPKISLFFCHLKWLYMGYLRRYRKMKRSITEILLYVINSTYANNVFPHNVHTLPSVIIIKATYVTLRQRSLHLILGNMCSLDLMQWLPILPLIIMQRLS